jgi:hypothetical protein
MSKFNHALILVVFILSILVFSACPVLAGLVNGDFSQDPPGTGWNYSSSGADVYSDATAWNGNGYADLYTYDEGIAATSVLYQDNIFLLPGETQLSFDIDVYKSGDIEETDTFTATFGSKQYTLQTSDFSGSSFIDTIVFDLTGMSSGPYTMHFQLENEPDDIYTSVYIDNVQFIPAPGAFLLAVIGIFSTATSRKLKA